MENRGSLQAPPLKWFLWPLLQSSDNCIVHSWTDF